MANGGKLFKVNFRKLCYFKHKSIDMHCSKHSSAPYRKWHFLFIYRDIQRDLISLKPVGLIV